MSTILIQLDERQVATVLVALREWQEVLDYAGGVPDDSIKQFAGAEPLTQAEIDELCEQIKAGPLDAKPPKPISVWVAVCAGGQVVEGFGTKEQADLFLLGRSDSVSGPWQIYCGG